MPDEYPIGIGIEGEQSPITVGAVINLSSPNGHPNFFHASAPDIIGTWVTLPPTFIQRELESDGRWAQQKAAEISN
jgi:hypothetical protein